MRQHALDLMPAAIRARNLAGVRAGRYVGAGVLTMLILFTGATHTKINLERARRQLELARQQADLVLKAEAKAEELRDLLREVEDQVGRYARIAMPLDVSAVLATMINELPEGITLDRLDVDAGPRRAARSPRDRGAESPEGLPPRVLSAEVSGFAPDDRAIADYVARLESRDPFREVSLDFSRTRSVRERLAREFRLSFRIDLDAEYRAAGSDGPVAGAAEEEGRDE